MNGKKKKTKLKNLEFSSVDMVRRGANQESYINLYKSEGDPPEPNASTDAVVAPDSNEIPQGLWKSIAEAVKSFLRTGEANEGDGEPDGVEKAAETFHEKREKQEIRDDRWKYQDALNMSVDSIMQDDSLTIEQKTEMLSESILQFSNAYMEMCEKLLKTTENKVTPTESVGKSRDDIGKSEESEEKNDMSNNTLKIDKSKFTPEELAQYDALVAKGAVEDNEPAVNEPAKEEPKVEKSAEMHPEVQKALDEMKTITKSLEMKEMTDIAKKYVVLGKKEDELANTLYDMKKSNPANYDEYIAVLDQSLALLEKSGQFTEIGKSSRGVAGGNAEEKIQTIAKGYLEKDPNLSYDMAVAKAWENNPELLEEYDNAY